MVLSVLDGSTLRTPHNIYVLDGSTVRRVRQIRALDGSTLRHPFTKTDYFDFSGTANTLNPAVAEVYQYTISGATNSGTQTVYTGYQQSNTGTTNPTNSYNWYFGAGNPGSTNGSASWTRVFGSQTQGRYLTGLNYWPNASSISMYYQVGGYIYNANTFRYGNIGVYSSNANIAGGTNNWSTYTHFVGPTTWSTKYHEPHGGPSVSGGTSGASPNHGLVSGSTGGYGYYGGSYNFNNGNSAGVGVRVYASFYAGYGASMQSNGYINVQMYGTQYYTYYTNHVSSSSSTVNLGATFSISGAGWSVGSTSFSNSNTASTHAETIRASIASALPSGWSVSRSNATVTITAPASSGNVNDMSVSISNGSGVNGGTNPSPGNSSTVRGASSVSGSGSTTTQGSAQSGNLTSATVTSGGNSTSVNLSNGASTDTAGSEIANAMNGLADTTATYDSSTNRMTVVASGDTSVSLSNPNSLSVSKVSL